MGIIGASVIAWVSIFGSILALVIVWQSYKTILHGICALFKGLRGKVDKIVDGGGIYLD